MSQQLSDGPERMKLADFGDHLTFPVTVDVIYQGKDIPELQVISLMINLSILYTVNHLV